MKISNFTVVGPLHRHADWTGHANSPEGKHARAAVALRTPIYPINSRVK
jgi:hypothetical protein